jgi:tight adherence protein B
MGMMQIAMLGAGVLAVLLLLIFAFADPSQSRAAARRLTKVKYRHSDSANVRVEAQMKKALSARRKTTRPKGDTMTKLEILAIRMEKTGKRWPLSYFFYAAGGLFPVCCCSRGHQFCYAWRSGCWLVPDCRISSSAF